MADEIRTVINEYWKKELPETKQREIALSLEPHFINDVVGPRRAGKTYLMFLTIQKLIEEKDKEATIYINFENRKLMPLKEQYFNDIVAFIYAEQLLETYDTVYLFLDEVQRMPNWEKYVRSIYDEFKDHIKIFVSGSSANLLSKEYASLLTGRHLTTRVFPLSFREFLRFRGCSTDNETERERALLKRHLDEYLRFGGFPDVVLAHEKENILSQLFTDIVSRDVLSRVAVRKEDVLDEFAYHLASNVSSLLSFNKMKNYFDSRGIQISVPTLTTYFSHLKNAFLFFDSRIFSYNVKDQMQYPRKIYCVDNGIANIAGFKTSQDLGALYENTVAVELLRRGNNLYYWKSKRQKEVDFVIKKGTQVRHLIQVCTDIRDTDTRKREKTALLKAMDEFDLEEGLIITGSTTKKETVKGKRIHYMPLLDWLLKR